MPSPAPSVSASQPVPEVPAAPAPLYKYVDIAGVRHILDGTIRFTQPSAFNDPFELLPEVIIPAGEPERKINLRFDILAPRKSPKEPAAPDDNTAGSDAMSRDIVQQLNGVIGILSLTKNRNSILMWSHYADQYAGAVVEFDPANEFFTGQIEMAYEASRPRRHVNTYTAGVPVPLSELCVKSEEWCYENEVRIIRPLNELERKGTDRRGFPIFVHQIPLDAIKGIILGERTPVPEQREIYERIKETKLTLSLAAVDQAGFSFREELVKFPVPLSEMMPMVSARTAHIFSHYQNNFGEMARWMIEKHWSSRIVNQPI